MDANVNCTQLAAKIVTARIKFVIRYYSKFSSKGLTLTEAGALSSAGLQLMAVYQDSNDKLELFTADLVTQQATRALGNGQEHEHSIFQTIRGSPRDGGRWPPVDVASSTWQRKSARTGAVQDSRHLVSLHIASVAKP